MQLSIINNLLIDPSDDVILADLPFALQGIPTETFPWHVARGSSELTTTVNVGMPETLAWPKLGLLNQLLEPAILYKDIKTKLSFREKHQGRSAGLVEQALCSAIDSELQNYLTFVGVIETEIRRQQDQNTRDNNHNNNSSTRGRGNGSVITLRRCVVLLQEATLGLRLIHSILTESRGLVGGQILSLIHNYTYNGDELVARFAQRLLPKVSVPFYDVLNRWIGTGQLIDPHEEFFVQPGDQGSRWEGRFVLVKDKVPSYMKPEVAQRVFQIGKTLYFVRVACDNREWVEERQAGFTALDAGSYGSGREDVFTTNQRLERQINDAYTDVVRHLNHTLREKFGLDRHLRGLKNYLLLGKGDFVQLLVETIAPSLDKPAVQLFRHHLTATLETAILGSNAHYDHEDVLRCLDARMLELGHGDIGWDVFTLDYRVEQPLDTVILDKAATKEYLRVFNFLWRIKRVSFALNRTWRKMATMERSGRLYIRLDSHNGGDDDSTIELASYIHELWKVVRATTGEMLHFINELQYYINYEVIETSWVQLQRDLTERYLSVDEIISVHREYLARITYKGLLGGGELYMGELHEILKNILSFRACVEGLHDITNRYNSGAANTSASGSGADEKRVLNIGGLIREIRVGFEDTVERLVAQLNKQEDGEMRFLGVRLDFNGFYSSRMS